MRVLLLVNSTASSVTPRARVLIRKALAERHDVVVEETSRRGHASRLARAAAHDGFDVVAVLAGDGTANEAADGLAGTDTALAPLPGGSTNVYARTLGFPNDPLRANEKLLAALERGSTTRVGLGRVGARHVLFDVGLGFDAAVIRRVERYGEFKRYASHPLHIVAAIETWFRHYDHSKPRFDVALPNGERIEGVYFAIVSKTQAYTYLGPRPLCVARDVDLHTPLGVTAFTRLDVVSLLGAAISAMNKGIWLKKRRGIVQRSGLDGLEVEGRGPFPYQVDGDDLGDADRLSITYEPNVLRVVVP
jgi:diacylglycerol kinase family enzyme